MNYNLNYNYHIRVDGNNHYGLGFHYGTVENGKKQVTCHIPFNFDGAVTDFEVIKCKPRNVIFGYKMLINGGGFNSFVFFH